MIDSRLIPYLTGYSQASDRADYRFIGSSTPSMRLSDYVNLSLSFNLPDYLADELLRVLNRLSRGGDIYINSGNAGNSGTISIQGGDTVSLSSAGGTINITAPNSITIDSIDRISPSLQQAIDTIGEIIAPQNPAPVNPPSSRSVPTVPLIKEDPPMKQEEGLDKSRWQFIEIDETK